MIEIMWELIADLFENARETDLKSGQTLFLMGRPVTSLFLVKSGRVQLQRSTPQGALMILQDAPPRSVVAEASVYTSHYHCDAVVVETGRVAALPRDRFLDLVAAERSVSEAWSAMLARSVQAARFRAEIRSLNKVADRLNAWLGEGNEVPDKGHWQDVAAELGVTREALYRELARRKGLNR